MKRFVLSGALLLAALPGLAHAQDPAGTEFRVNTYTFSVQLRPSVAASANGDFVVVWQSFADGSLSSIAGQLFDASGLRKGAEFVVNTYTTNRQVDPSVASDANGNFVVVWESYGQDGSSYGIFGRRFDAAGVAQGPDFPINTYTTFSERFPRVSSDATGRFVVVWQAPNEDGSAYGIFGQRFDSSGVRQGTEFRVNSYTTGSQSSPSVASDASGNFIVAWAEFNGEDGSGSGVFAQRYDAAGVKQGSEFRVNSYTTSDQSYPSVSADAAGNFVVAWQSKGQDGNLLGIFAQRLDPSATPLGSEFRVNSYTTGDQSRPLVSSSGDGAFVVVWQSAGQDGNDVGVFGQRYDAAGLPRGGEFQVNTYTTGAQSYLGVASDADGDFLVAWSGPAPGDSSDVFAQRYGDLIFEDGFETGDVSRWSSASTDGLDLSVSGAAAMAGTVAGLQAFVNDTNPLFVEDDSPAEEDRYRARFYIDTNGFDPGEASGHLRVRIFIGFDDQSHRLFTLVLRRQSGAYSVEGRVRRNDGSRADTGFFPLPPGPHSIEIDWLRSSAPGASDGVFTLRIDGLNESALTFLDDDASPVGFVRLGAIAIKSGASGTLLFDQFESRRQRAIGPE